MTSMMDRRRFLLTSLAGALAAPLAAEAQQAGKVFRLGFLSASSATASPRYLEAFQQARRELGWREGQNIVIEYRFAEGGFDKLPDLAAGLVRLKVDVIVANLTPTAVAAKNTTATTPIVMINGNDPVRIGLVASLARPGGNVTGVAYSVGLDIFGKIVELLKETVPRLRRVAVLSNPRNPIQPLQLESVKSAAQRLGLELQLLELRGPGDFAGAFKAMALERTQAYLNLGVAFGVDRVRLAELAVKHKMPSVYGNRADVEAGGFMSYGPDLIAQMQRAALFVDKILKGAEPAELPVEQPSKFEFVINLKTAKALGLTIPPSLLARADQVIDP
jgi:putative ABC transport system substrate-binding protein